MDARSVLTGADEDKEEPMNGGKMRCELSRGMKVAEFKTGEDLYEVYRSLAGKYPYAGYFNGRLSVTATHPAIAIRGLQRKHTSGLPKGELIDFAAAVKSLRD